MEINIIKEKETPLLSRKRYTVKLTGGGSTPSRKQLVQAISSKTKANPNLTIIKHIYPQFGGKFTKIIAHVYKNMNAMEKVEHEYLKKKHKEEKKSEKPEEAGEKGEVKKEKPAEPKKEEPAAKEEKPTESKEEKAPAK